MSQNKTANISDVAKRANVSVATVSRYIRTPEKVAKKSAIRVDEAIRALNYKPNLLARSFSEKRSYTVLVLAPDITNPFLAQLILGIEEVGMEAGYRIILGESRIEDERQQGYLELADSGLVDGVIQLFGNDKDSIIERQKTTPIILVAEFEDDSPCSTVSIDDELAAFHVTEYLVSLGHRHIVCLGVIPSLRFSQRRLNGYKRSLQHNGIDFDQSLVFYGDFSPESGFENARKVTNLAEKPTAVFCMNDLMALGMIHGLREQGLNVPKDISVAGFDDIEVVRYTSPPLTSVRQPARELGRHSMKMMLEELRDKSSEQRRYKSVYLDHELVVRGSTGPAP